MIRQTSIARTLDVIAEKAKYDACAKKLLTYKAIIAWILRTCTKEFSQLSVEYIMKNCIADEPVISTDAVHQDENDRTELLDGDKRIEGLNTESNSIKERKVFYDIKFKAVISENLEPIRMIINLEIQTDDNPGYPILKRGFYYCARMISEQYGTVFTAEEYDKIQKVYSIWICPDPAKKRRNGVFKYHTVEETITGTPYAAEEQYNLMEVVILNLGDVGNNSEQRILELLNTLFSTELTPAEKKNRLSNGFDIAMTEEFESEVEELCNLSGAIFELGQERGEEIGKEIGKAIGQEIGENRILLLMQNLFAAGRIEDAKRVTKDREYCTKLLAEFVNSV